MTATTTENLGNVAPALEDFADFELVGSGNETYLAHVVPGKYILVMKADGYGKGKFACFNVGDLCEIGSFNLTYLGYIESITKKTVVIVDDHERDMEKKFPDRPRAKRKHMKLREFAWRNYNFNLPHINAQNAETSMSI